MIGGIIKWTLILAVVLVAVYCAYIGGLLTIHTHAAFMYVGNIKQARFSKCNGTFKRVIRFKEAKSYRFELSQELTQGSISAEVLDSRKEVVLSLDGKNHTGNIYPQEKARYYLVVKIENASGKYSLDWT